MLKQRLDILQQIANNPVADHKAGVEAHHLAVEIAAIILKLYADGPIILSQRHAFPKSPLTETDTTCLVLKKKKEEEEEYDELEEEEELEDSAHADCSDHAWMQ